ncbi:MAG: nucleotide sugar dehydrogenase [Patescibacteria group bacterium]
MISFKDLCTKKERICIVGLGYVGLPLACLFAKEYSVIGFDINKERIKNLKKGVDTTGEIKKEQLAQNKIKFSFKPEIIKQAKFIILAIPTPIDENKKPDLFFLKEASTVVGRNLVKNSVVVYESTVYPGVTEEIILPILERESGLKAGIDFNVGYSPERINPGDREHTIDKVVKIVAGQNEETLNLVDKLYSSVIKAGTYRVYSIKVAEAAKAIENTQRDLNIALVNELAIIFKKMNIDTHEVLAAAGSKWNFNMFSPGLVGGHCIGVDPYYLTYKAESLGYHPEVILAGRRINDSMGKYVAQQTIKKMARLDKATSTARIAILGFTFKENISDIRNTKVADLYYELKDFGLKPIVFDPLADNIEVKKEYGIELCQWEEIKNIDTIIIAVPHEKFLRLSIADYRNLMNADKLLIVDIKKILNGKEVADAGIEYWTL